MPKECTDMGKFALSCFDLYVIACKYALERVIDYEWQNPKLNICIDFINTVSICSSL